MKKLISILLVFITFNSFAQKDTLAHRHYGAMQFGGQTMVSFHYEYSLIARNYFILNTNAGLGLNENADDTDPTDRPIYGIHSGIICLAGPKLISLELGIYPTTYFYKTTTFVNLNSWAGIRLRPQKMEGFFMSVGYTPRLYYTYSDPNNHFFNAAIAAKFGINF